MSRSAPRALIVLVALTNAALFIVYQRPDWPTQWTDQNGYSRLGGALAQSGRFTRYPDYPRFVPEVLRTPGYPLFVAAVNRTLGRGQLPVAIAQAVVFAGICLLIVSMARRVASERTALAAGFLTALYPTLPYFGALTLTELFTAFVVTLGLYAWQRALRGGNGWAAGAGGALAWAALTRPAFQLLPAALIAAAVVVAPGGSIARRRSALMLGVWAIVVTPWLLYNVIYLHAFTFTPAGGIGRTIWEGAWQVELPGRVKSALTERAERIRDPAALDDAVRAYAAQVQRDPDPMLRYVHEWQRIRTMWDAPQEPWERAVARVAADKEYGRVGLENIRRDPVGHVWRRATRGVALLWITEIPVRYTDINQLPPLAIRAMWFLQALLMAAALGGLRVLWRQGAHSEAAAFGAILVYVTAVHAVLYSEARYAVPVKPAVLLLATLGVARFSAKTRGSTELPPSQSQTER